MIKKHTGDIQKSVKHFEDEYLANNEKTIVRNALYDMKELYDYICDKLLTSSLRTPEVIVKEFFYVFVTFYDHCSGEYLSVERQSDLRLIHSLPCLTYSSIWIGSELIPIVSCSLYRFRFFSATTTLIVPERFFFFFTNMPQK